MRTFSFVAALAIIGAIIASTYLASTPRIDRIPVSFVFKVQPWMRYVPGQVNYVSHINYEQASAILSNAELFGPGALIRFYQLSFNVMPEDVQYEVDIQLAGSSTGTVTLLRLRDDSMRALASAVANSANTPSWEHGGHIIHGLLTVKQGDQKPATGFMSLANGDVVLTTEQGGGRQQLERILDQYDSNAPSLFDDSNVRKAVYASGVSDEPYVGLFIGLFATQLTETTMVVKSILQDRDGIIVTRSFMFATESIALSHYSEAQRVYRNAQNYRILDSWIVVAYRYPIDKLKGELTGI